MGVGDVVRQPPAGILADARDEPRVDVGDGLTRPRAEVETEVEVDPARRSLADEPEQAQCVQRRLQGVHLVPLRHDLVRTGHRLAVFHDQIRPWGSCHDLFRGDHAVAEAERTSLCGSTAAGGTCSNHDAPHLSVAPNATFASGIINYSTLYSKCLVSDSKSHQLH